MMQKYIIGILAAALLVSGWFYHEKSSDLSDARAALAATKTALAAAVAANEANQAAIERLQDSAKNTAAILAGWNEDRTTLSAVRNSTRQAIKEAMRDETFKVWAATPIPPDVWRMLSDAIGRNGNENGAHNAAAGASGRLPGNADPSQRRER